MRDTDIPSPNEHELLLKVSMAGICGSDLSGYLGENSLRQPPLVMGHEFSATVYGIGKSVRGWSVGQLVTVNPLLSCGACDACRRGIRQLCSTREIIGIHRPGAFAEYVVVPASACFPMSNELQGALVEPLACAARATSQADIRLGDEVLVIGAGIIGLMCTEMAKKRGAVKRVVVDTNTARLAKALEWGATHIVNPHEGDVIDIVRSISSDGINKAIDAVGLPTTRQQSLKLIHPGGRVVFVGLHEDETNIPANLIARQEVEIHGSFCYRDEDFLLARRLLENGEVQSTGKWVDIRPLEYCQESFEEQIFGPATYPKIVLRVG